MQLTSIYLLGAAGVCPNRDKVMGRERNLQGSSSLHGAAPGAQHVPLGSCWDEKGTCNAALPLEVVPGARYVPFLLLS